MKSDAGGTELLEGIARLEKRVSLAAVPPDLEEKMLLTIKRLERMIKFGRYSSEYEQAVFYIEWVTELPWNKRSEDILDMEKAKEVLYKNHYGLEAVKDRILEYLAVMSLRRERGEGNGAKEEGILKFMRAPILCLVGLVGTGKTTLAYSIAEAMGREFARIPFGGMGSALDLRGQSRAHPDAEPGLVLKAVKRCGTKNPVILLDEIDRVSDNARSEIMGVLVELLDPEQNAAFRDHFVDFPFDLSQALFIATCNNTTNISTAVLDRLEPLQMPSYNDQEKIIIGQKYVLPRLLKESGLTGENLKIDKDVWPKIVRPLGYDAGIRTLGRTINTLCRKVAKMIVEGQGKNFHITTENIKEYIPIW
ncbi:MAG: AAA family ATPase [Candidatus Pacebacteria bacterium]|nr:AAA family ATPase [Candidatus Paceibacterota bacterium]